MRAGTGCGSWRVTRDALAAIALLAVVAQGPGAGAQELTFAPFLQQASTDSILIAWETDTPAQPSVRYGPTEAMALTKATDAAATRHEVRLEGLEPGATYHYQLFIGDTPLSAPSTFPTAVEPGTPFSFLAFGDTRSDATAHDTVSQAMVDEPGVRLYLQTGDLVSDGEVYEQWVDYFAIEQPLMRKIPIYPVIGNHEEHGGEVVLFKQLFALPEDTPAPEEYYAFSYGNVRFIALDGHVNWDPGYACIDERDIWLVEGCFDAPQTQWLQAQLKAAAQDEAIDHVVVAIHVGPYSSKTGRTGNGHMRRLMPMLYEYGVTLVISGHDHYYERGLSSHGIPYVISAGGGAPLYEIGEPIGAPHTVDYNESTYHYMVVEVDGKTMSLTAKTPDGKILDWFEVTAVEDCAVDLDCEAFEPPPGCEPPATCSVAGRCAFTCALEGENPFPPEPEPEAAEAGPEPQPEPTPEGPAAPPEPAPTAPEPEPPGAPDPAAQVGTGGDEGCHSGPSGAPLPWALALGLLALATRRRAARR